MKVVSFQVNGPVGAREAGSEAKGMDALLQARRELASV